LRPTAASHRGDSGTRKNRAAVRAENAAATTKAQRQPSMPSGSNGVSQRIRKISAGAPRKAKAAQSIMLVPRRCGGNRSAR
jgi:hypothetical protein